MTDPDALRTAVIDALHAHDCKGDPWPITLTPTRHAAQVSRADAVLEALAPLLAAAAVEHDQRGYERRRAEEADAASASYAWPPVTAEHYLGGHPDGLPCLTSLTDPTHVPGRGCRFEGTSVPQVDDTEAMQS